MCYIDYRRTWNIESTEKVKPTFRLKVNNGEIVVFPFLFLSIIALLRRFVERKVINRKHFLFWSLKNWTFSVLSKYRVPTMQNRLGNLTRPPSCKSFYHQGFFAVKRRAVFILGAKWNASHLAVRLCALRHWKQVSMPPTTQSHPPPSHEGSPHCPKDKNRSPFHGEKPLMIKWILEKRLYQISQNDFAW